METTTYSVFLICISPLTLDVEVLRVALPVALAVGGDAGVEAGVRAAHLLQHQRLVADQHAPGDVLHYELALEEEGGRKKRERGSWVQRGFMLQRQPGFTTMDIYVVRCRLLRTNVTTIGYSDTTFTRTIDVLSALTMCCQLERIELAGSLMIEFLKFHW